MLFNSSKLKKILLFLLIILNISAFSQLNPSGLKKLLDSTRKERNDSIRVVLNSTFYDELYGLMKQSDFVPDSIKSLKIGQSASDDGKLIFYNWNIQQNDGQNLYCAIVYAPITHKVIALPVRPSEKSLDPDSIYQHNAWPGALYYKIISPKTKTDNYYLLLGWDRFSRQTTRKTIEAISFLNDSTIVFGKEVFKIKEGKTKRIIIEYASSANLALHYSKQKLTLTGVRKSQSKVNDSIIVVDRLAPLNEGLEGQRWAYVPVGNIYDGYIYFKGFWTFVEGINARNPAIRKEDRKKAIKPDMELLPQ